MCNTLYIYSLTHSVGVFFLLVVFTLDRLFVKEINRNRDKNKLRPRMCVCTKSGRLVEAANLESKWKNNTANRRCGEFAAAAVVAATSWSFVSFLFVVNEKTFKAAHPHIFGIKKLPRSPYGCVCVSCECCESIQVERRRRTECIAMGNGQREESKRRETNRKQDFEEFFLLYSFVWSPSSCPSEHRFVEFMCFWVSVLWAAQFISSGDYLPIVAQNEDEQRAVCRMRAEDDREKEFL